MQDFQVYIEMKHTANVNLKDLYTTHPHSNKNNWHQNAPASWKEEVQLKVGEGVT